MTYEDACYFLDIPLDANLETARAAHRRLAKLYHPDSNRDTGGDSHQFQLVTDAWECVQKTITMRQAQEEEWKKQQEEERQRKREEEERRKQEEEEKTA